MPGVTGRPGRRNGEGIRRTCSGRQEFLGQLAKCLEALPPNLQRAFTLREIDGADTKEICKVLSVTDTNLWVILHRARARLRECLETRWFGRSVEGS